MAPLNVRLWIDHPAWFVGHEREIVVDGDRTLIVGLDFSDEMDQPDVENRLRTAMPTATTFQWPSAASLRAQVPAGDSFDIMLDGARSRAGTIATGQWHIARPLNEVSLYKLEGAVTWPAQTKSWQLRLVVQMGLLIIAPDATKTLLYHGITPRKSEFSLVDLASGQHLADPFEPIPGKRLAGSRLDERRSPSDRQCKSDPSRR